MGNESSSVFFFLLHIYFSLILKCITSESIIFYKRKNEECHYWFKQLLKWFWDPFMMRPLRNSWLISRIYFSMIRFFIWLSTETMFLRVCVGNIHQRVNLKFSLAMLQLQDFSFLLHSNVILFSHRLSTLLIDQLFFFPKIHSHRKVYWNSVH